MDGEEREDLRRRASSPKLSMSNVVDPAEVIPLVNLSSRTVPATTQHRIEFIERHGCAFGGLFPIGSGVVERWCVELVDDVVFYVG